MVRDALKRKARDETLLDLNLQTTCDFSYRHIYPLDLCTLIASSNGSVRYLISKPMRKASGDSSSKGEARFARQQDYLKMCDLQNPLTPYYTASEYPERMLEMMNFANLHGG